MVLEAQAEVQETEAAKSNAELERTKRASWR
jgi:hypothetical protein